MDLLSSSWFMACAVASGLLLDAIWLILRPTQVPYALKWAIIFYVGHKLLEMAVAYNKRWFKKNRLPPPHFGWIMMFFHPHIIQELTTVVLPQLLPGH